VKRQRLVRNSKQAIEKITAEGKRFRENSLQISAKKRSPIRDGRVCKAAGLEPERRPPTQTILQERWVLIS